MKALRTIGILVLVAVLMLGSAGSILAQGPHGGPHSPGKRHGFAGKVTDVDITSGNVTIGTAQGWSVTVTLNDEFRYKIPKTTNRWELGNVSDFASHFGDDLTTIEGRKVVVLAYNVIETAPGTFSGEVLKIMVLPVPGERLHAHRTGNVTVFNPPSAANTYIGNITIVDVHGGNHTFVVDNDTLYHPDGITAGNITAYKSFVTVVTTKNPKLEPDEKAIAKAIVLHRWRQDT